ncbi:MAG: trypco2 family protein [Candidatus Aquirickettsiella gammari]
MKGNISLKDFIQSVKAELMDSIDNTKPFFEMKSVQLEVSFGVDVEGEAGCKFFVFDSKVKGGAKQSHKVTIDLLPFVDEPKPISSPPVRRKSENIGLKDSSPPKAFSGVSSRRSPTAKAKPSRVKMSK